MTTTINNDILFNDAEVLQSLSGAEESLSFTYNDCTNNYNDCTNNVFTPETIEY